MLKGKTSTGFEYEISDDALGDWEITEALVDIDDGKYSAAVKVIRLLLGADQAKKLKEHCRDKESGRVTQKAMFAELADILSSSNSDDDKSKNA